MDRYIDLIPLALIALLLWRCKPVRPLSGFREDYLAAVPCRSLRGFFALVVILHHLSQQTGSGSLFQLFRYFGTLPVSVFFFLSGYGLMRQYLLKPGYGRRFLLRRLPPLLGAYLFVLLAIKLVYAVGGESVSLSELTGLVLSGDLIMCILWYVLVAVLFYLVFGLLMHTMGNRPGAVLLGMGLWYLLYAALCWRLRLGQWLYNTCHLMVVGMLWAYYEKGLLSFIKRSYWILAPCVWLLFAVLFQCFDDIFALWPVPVMRLAISLVRSALFALSMVLLSMKLRLGNAALDWLGGISLELYVLQLIPMTLLRGRVLYIQSDLLYTAAALGSIVLLAALLGPPYERLIRRYRLALDKS